jgi:hypothetical protein
MLRLKLSLHHINTYGFTTLRNYGAGWEGRVFGFSPRLLNLFDKAPVTLCNFQVIWIIKGNEGLFALVYNYTF